MTPKWPYRRIADDLREQIRTGKLKPGDKLPTRSELAEAYSVSDMTVGAAIRVLRDEGLIESERGLGMFVKED